MIRIIVLCDFLSVLTVLYPHFQWQENRVARLKEDHSTSLATQIIGFRGTWRNIANQRNFLDALAKEMEIKSPSDWSRVRSVDVNQRGGSGLLKVYGGSLVRALSTIYHVFHTSAEKQK